VDWPKTVLEANLTGRAARLSGLCSLISIERDAVRLYLPCIHAGFISGVEDLAEQLSHHFKRDFCVAVTTAASARRGGRKPVTPEI
jgi:hypothetical protein